MRRGAYECSEHVRRRGTCKQHAARGREAGRGMRGRWCEACAGGVRGAQYRHAGDSAWACAGGEVDGSVGLLAGWFDLWVQVMDQWVHHPM
jgi:hypothetical protein